MSTFEDAVAEFEGDWDTAPTGGGQSALPAGNYQTKVKIARVEMSNYEPAQWQLFLVFEDLAGAGEQPVWCGLENDGGVKVARSLTSGLGYDGPLSGLKKACEDGFFEDLICEIRVKDKQGDERVFKQVFVNKLLGRSVGNGGAAVQTDDDIPF